MSQKEIYKNYYIPMESPSRKIGGQFYGALGDPKFPPIPGGGLGQMGGLNLFTLLGGQQGFLYWGGWGDSLSH